MLFASYKKTIEEFSKLINISNKMTRTKKYKYIIIYYLTRIIKN